MDTILNLIRKGINVKSFFSYEDIEIPIRAISTTELDSARVMSLGIVDDKLSRMILRLRLGQLRGKVDVNAIPPDMWRNYLEYIWEFDYWVVYYSMKDYRDLSFSVEDVKKMRLVHKMASKIINMSTVSYDILTEFIRTEDGQELAKVIYEFKQPLNSELWKLTPLQSQFLVLTDPKKPKHVADSIEDLEKILPTIGDVMYRARR